LSVCRMESRRPAWMRPPQDAVIRMPDKRPPIQRRLALHRIDP
jgi:hypothetical protein